LLYSSNYIGNGFKTKYVKNFIKANLNSYTTQKKPFNLFYFNRNNLYNSIICYFEIALLHNIKKSLIMIK